MVWWWGSGRYYLVTMIAVAWIGVSGCGLVNALQEPPEEGEIGCEEQGACPAPEGLEVLEESSDALTLEWEPVDGAEGYLVRWDDEEERLLEGQTKLKVRGLAQPEFEEVDAPTIELSVEERWDGEWSYSDQGLRGEEINFEVRALFGDEYVEGAAANTQGQTLDYVEYLVWKTDQSEVVVEFDSRGDYSGVYEVGDSEQGGSVLGFDYPSYVEGAGVQSARFEYELLPDLYLDMSQTVEVLAKTQSQREEVIGQLEVDLPRFEVEIHYRARHGSGEDGVRTEEEVIPFGAEGIPLWDEVAGQPVDGEPEQAKLEVESALGWAEEFGWVDVGPTDPRVFMAGQGGSLVYDRREGIMVLGDGAEDEDDPVPTCRVLSDPAGNSFWLEGGLLTSMPADTCVGERVVKRGPDGQELWSDELEVPMETSTYFISDMILSFEGTLYATSEDFMNLTLDEDDDDDGQWYIHRVDFGSDGETEETSVHIPYGEVDGLDNCVAGQLEVDAEGRVYALCQGTEIGQKTVIVKLDSELSVVDSIIYTDPGLVSPLEMRSDGEGRVVLVGDKQGDQPHRVHWIDISDGLPETSQISQTVQLDELEIGDEVATVDEVLSVSAGLDDQVMAMVEAGEFIATVKVDASSDEVSILAAYAIETLEADGVDTEKGFEIEMAHDGRDLILSDRFLLERSMGEFGDTLGVFNIGRVSAMSVAPGRVGQFKEAWEAPPRF